MFIRSASERTLAIALVSSLISPLKKCLASTAVTLKAEIAQNIRQENLDVL
jgi:hypothetical protein